MFTLFRALFQRAFQEMEKFGKNVKEFVTLGPREFCRVKIKQPVAKFVYDTVNLYKIRTQQGVNNVRELIFRGIIVAIVTALLVWLAIFMYIAFYYAYVPVVSHERPVHLRFRACEANDCERQVGKYKRMCSFPSAHIKLTERQRLLMLGQPYKVHLELEMPESPTNRELGMFMVCADFQGANGKILANSCRSTMLHYKGFLLDNLYKIVYIPFYLFGNAEEKQNVHVELFSDFEEIEDTPVTDIFIEIQSTDIEIYSAKFLINARFTGLRFLMYSWPVFSAAVGITSNLIFVAIVCMVSWYQIINSNEYNQYAALNSFHKIQPFEEFEEDSSDDGVSFLDESNIVRKRENHSSNNDDFIEDIF